jgi:flagellar hook-associated protein 3 FlgL
MRIAFSQTYAKMTFDINRKKEDIDRLTTMATTGERMLKPADDPVGWSQAMDFRQSLRELAIFQKNADFATGWNQATESALTHVADLVIEARDLGIRSISVQTPESRQALVDSLDQLFKEALSLSNSQYGDRYLFSGQKFSTKPFELGVDPATGEPIVDPYQGDGQTLQVRLGKDLRETVNITGDMAFANPGADVLKQLLELKKAVQDNDTTATQQQLGLLDSSRQNLVRLSAQVGTRMASLERKQDLFASLNVDNQGQLADIAEADIVDVITRLKQKQTVFEAALQITSTLSELNLTRFL